MRHVLFAAVGKTHIGTRHLQGRHQDVTLADGDVRHIAGIPFAVLGRGIGKVRLFPFGIGNAARALTRQIDTAGLAHPPATKDLLQTLGVLVVVEKCLAHVVEDGVARVGDTRLQRHDAVAGVQPAILAPSLAQARPIARAVGRLR